MSKNLSELSGRKGLKENLFFTAFQPTAMDSIVPIVCIQDTLQLIFNKPINCNSIAPDGSDFSITGPSVVNISSAKGICNGGVSSSIQIILSKPIKINGGYQIKLNNNHVNRIFSIQRRVEDVQIKSNQIVRDR